jgi:hypothetical protein
MKKLHSFLYIGFCLAIVFHACKEPIEPLPELTVTTLQTTIEYGNTATISWAAINATACSLDAGNITGVTGSFTTPPLTKTTTYSFTAVGPGGTVTATITIQVNAAPKPILKVTVDNDTIRKGQTVNLLIESTNAVSINIKGVSSGNISENTPPVTTEKTFDVLNGTFTSWLILETTQFTVTATGIDGSTEVASPPIIVIPTRTDTITGRYWKMVESKIFYKNEWLKVNLDEDQLTWRTYFYQNGDIKVIDPRDNRTVGSGYGYNNSGWSWIDKDSIQIGSGRYRYELTDSTFSRSISYEDRTFVINYERFK